VELLAIHANLAVVGATITVFDGKRGQIIYKEEQGEQVYTSCLMSGLIIIGPYESFDILACDINKAIAFM